MNNKDPYSVLGIAPNATDEEVKSAYRQMARKYHPDNYDDSPLSDLAQEKMQEINQAYDTIVNMRQRGAAPTDNYGHDPYQQVWSSGAGQGNSQYFDIRNMVRSGRIEEAETLLDGIPESARDAEWYFLKGSVLYRKGWLDGAYNHYAQAVRMDPANQEYRTAFDHMNNQRGTGGYRTGGAGQRGCSMCDICAGMMCADLCCRCMC